MKVLHVLNELRLSGMEMMLLNSALEWGKYGISIDILATGNNPGIAAVKLKNSGYNVMHIPFYQNKWQTFLKFRNLLLQNRYDIIHLSTEGNFLLNCLNSRCIGNTKIVLTFHSIFQPRTLGRIRRNVDRQLAKLFSVRYVSVGDSVAQNELKHFYTKSEIIYNWYDNERFYIKSKEQRDRCKVELNIPEKTFVISTIGNCSAIKRHHLVIEALTKLPVSLNWIYLHAGDEVEEFPERALAKFLGIHDRCRFLGPVANVEDILAISDVYIMSSKVEGLSIAALEAMACGVPTVLTKVPGLQDLIEKIDGVIGVDSTPKCIADGIMHLLSLDKTQRKRLSDNIHYQVETMFSMSKGVKNYSNFYNKLLLK